MSISTSNLLFFLSQTSDLLSFFQKYEDELIKETPGGCLYALLDKYAIGSTLSECQTLLRISRHALLDPRFHRDGALIFALERGIGLSRCNDLLFDIKEDTL